MGLFSKIVEKIFHHDRAAPAASAGQGSAPPAAAPQATAAATTASSPAPVDVEAVLASMAQIEGGGGNWRASIVDLLKLLQLDSSLEARKGLADELNVHARRTRQRRAEHRPAQGGDEEAGRERGPGPRKLLPMSQRAGPAAGRLAGLAKISLVRRA
jgi:hypothetical protein